MSKSWCKDVWRYTHWSLSQSMAELLVGNYLNIELWRCTTAEGRVSVNGTFAVNPWGVLCRAWCQTGMLLLGQIGCWSQMPSVRLPTEPGIICCSIHISLFHSLARVHGIYLVLTVLPEMSQCLRSPEKLLVLVEPLEVRWKFDHLFCQCRVRPSTWTPSLLALTVYSLTCMFWLSGFFLPHFQIPY